MGSDAGPPTYSMKKAQAKADEEALAEIKKYKGLYDTGAKRIARFQQEVECQKIALERHEKQKKELQGKVALLQDQLDSIKTRSVWVLLEACPRLQSKASRQMSALGHTVRHSYVLSYCEALLWIISHGTALASEPRHRCAQL